jgi:hypothetical protein
MIQTSVRNPWKNLPSRPPYILADELDSLKEFNSSPKTKEDERVQLNLLPEPFLGRPDAPVVLLNLNPGFNTRNDHRQHGNAFFAERSRTNLLHGSADYPFYLLDPGIEDRTKWWEHKLKKLIEGFGCRTVANAVLCVEYFPYHSKKFSGRLPHVPSQKYSFWLARQAIHRQALILIMRSERRWLEAVPELASYAHRYTANSCQNPAISRSNFPMGFEAAFEAIKTFRPA